MLELLLLIVYILTIIFVFVIIVRKNENNANTLELSLHRKTCKRGPRVSNAVQYKWPLLFVELLHTVACNLLCM